MDLGFTDWKSNVCTISSTWKQKRELVSHLTQTDNIINEEKAVQYSAANHAEVQTVTEEETRPFSGEEFEKLPPSLFAFFSRVTDPVCLYLEQNCDPLAAEVFQDVGDDDAASESERSRAVKEYTLRSENVPPQFISSCLGWSKTGSQIAVGYSHPSHESWCSHKAPVSSWNILRRKHNFHENRPTAEIFLPSCVCCLEFHPMDSSILAVGLYSGEVALVDLFSLEKGSFSMGATNNDDPTTSYSGTSKMEDEWTHHQDSTSFVSDFGYTCYSAGHTAPVVAVKWVRLSSSQYSDILQSGSGKARPSAEGLTSHCCLITPSKDGFISFWSTNKANNRLKLEKRFVVWADNLPDEVNIGNRNVNGMKEVGVTGLSLCKDDGFAFVFSTFGSYLFQGSLLSTVEACEAEAFLHEHLAINRDTLFTPAPVLLGQQEGYVVALDCSPFHRNVFLCGTSDGRVFLKNLLQTSASVKEITAVTQDLKKSCSRSESGDCPLSDLQWSAARPTLFGLTLGNQLKIFDLLQEDSPLAVIDHEVPLTRLAFNTSGSGPVAVSDEKGQIHIWKLPSKIISQHPREMEAFVEATSVTLNSHDQFNF